MKNSSPFFMVLVCCVFAFSSKAQVTVGLQLHEQGSLDSGYVLFAPITYHTTYLIDKCGKLVHSWDSQHNPGLSVYLLPDGTLLRTGNVIDSNYFNSGGTGGIIEKIDWDGNVIWSYKICDSTQCQHHDIEPLPNGNILVIVWENRSVLESRAKGKKIMPGQKSTWSDKIVELQPSGTDQANIVWEWKVWDHLVQDFDPNIKPFDSVGQHPELIDINYLGTAQDWLHVNSIKYNADLDQILISNHNWSEFWIVDHSTTTAQAASHTGGKRNKGGDLLYRWGNPAAYRRGTASTQKLFQQHDVNWIPKGFTDAGKIMLFNNGAGRPAGAYSSVEIMTPPVTSPGVYNLKTIPYLPSKSDWIYTAPVKTDFYSSFISGAQMLSNGNVLVCNGNIGDFFEITMAGKKVWDYVNPVTSTGPVSQGTNLPSDVFRCTFYPKTYSAFTGRTMTPGDPIELNPAVYKCSTDTNLNQTGGGTGGIANVLATGNFSCVNPFSNVLAIRAHGIYENVIMELCDVTGRHIQAWHYGNPVNDDTQYFEVEGALRPGIYFLNISGNHIMTTLKLVKD